MIKLRSDSMPFCVVYRSWTVEPWRAACTRCRPPTIASAFTWREAFDAAFHHIGWHRRHTL